MVFETPPLVVSRPVAACSRCKLAKTRCDGKLPSCTACEKAGKSADCSSRREDEFARGRERSYVATLEARIDRLKLRLAQAGRQDLLQSSRLSPGPGYTSDNPSSPPAHALGVSQNPKATQKKEADDIESLVSNFGVLSVNAAARDFHGFTQTMSYARLIMAAAARQPIVSAPGTPLPARHEATRIAQHYLNGIFAFLPIFEEGTFWRALDQCYAANARPSQMDAWVVRMVLAISLISQSEVYQDAYYNAAVSHIAAALELAEVVLRPGSIPSIQAILLLVEYARYDPVKFDAWTLVGAVARAIVDLGLHQDPPRGSSMSKTKLQVRRRLFHCVYCLDRSTSIAHDLAFSFSDSATNVCFPGMPPTRQPAASPEIRIWKQNNNGLLATFQLRKIQSEAYQAAYQTSHEPCPEPYTFVWSKWHEVEEWFTHFPSTLTPHSKTIAELELLCTNIYLLAPSPRAPDIAELAQSLIFEHSIAYSAALRRALGDPSCRPWLTYLEAVRACKVGRIFVQNLTRYRARLLSGTLPNVRASLYHNSLTPPPFPYPPRTDNLERAFNCITSIAQILEDLGVRFGLSTLSDEFKTISQDLLNDLSNQAYTLPPALPTFQTASY